MPIPDFVVELRKHIGHASLWLPGVTAVIRRGQDILLVRRSDDGQWAPVTGIVDPGEEPAVAARREALEETGVQIRVDRLASVSVGPPVTHVNGDQATYLDHTFACTWLDGEAHVADDESVEVGWFAPDALPDLVDRHLERIAAATSDEVATRFRAYSASAPTRVSWR
jgi:8-oxo-dGTP pyrophosphatase MutT (NUDIX family)